MVSDSYTAAQHHEAHTRDCDKTMGVLASTLCLALAMMVIGNHDLSWAVTPDQSSRVLTEAEDIARTIEDEDLRTYTLRQMAVGYAYNDVWDQAERLATSLPPGHEHDQAFRLLVAQRAQENNIPEALRLRNGIGNENERDLVWTAGVIVNHQAQGNGIAAARQTAMAWPDGPVRAKALLGLAWGQVDQKDFSGALQTVRVIPVVQVDGLDMSPGYVLSLIINHQLEQGAYQDARRTAELYWEVDERTAEQRRIQVAQLQHGEMAEVYTRMKTVEDPAVRAGVLQSLAVRAAQHGDVDSATKMINEISSARHQRIAQAEMFATMAEAGYIAKALGSARRLTSPAEQAESLRRIVLSSAKQLDREPFFQLLTEQEPILKPWRGQDYDYFLRDVALLRNKYKDKVGAMRAIEQIAQKRTRNIALVELARAQAEAGDLAESRQTLGRMTRSDELVFGIHEIVLEHAKRGQFVEARELVSRQVDDDSSYLIARAEQYRDIAYLQAKKGDREGALRWTRVLPTSIERAFAVFGAGLGPIIPLPSNVPVIN